MLVVAFGIVLALAAAVRSTWSPCGQSMLSQITPVAEAGRGQKFGRSASWFVLGALLGGMCLGAVMAVAAALVAGAGPSRVTSLTVVAACALAAASVDTHVLGFGPPFLRRQVNEDWLAQYRPWVYGGGFGWQIGTGVTTYVMTAAVPLTIAVGALTSSWRAAFAIGVGFGLVRGLAVLLGVPLRTLADLHAFHRRFTAWGEPVRQVVIGVQVVVAVVAAWLSMPAPGALAISAAGAALIGWTRVRAARSASDSRRVPARAVPIALEQ